MANLSIKKTISHHLNMRALNKHVSKLGWRDAPRYTKYLKHCQKAFVGELPNAEKYKDNIEEFGKLGATAVWNEDLEFVANEMYARITQLEAEKADIWNHPSGTLYSAHKMYSGDLWLDFPELENVFRGAIGDILTNVFKANFKIYYTSMAKSVGVSDEPAGSQQWHNDAGPGTCIIIAMYLHPTDETSGCLQTLPWEHSLDIYRQERAADKTLQAEYCAKNNIRIEDLDKMTIRSLRHEFYDDIIQTKYKDEIRMPFGKAGSTVLFRNNALHRGGQPDIGKERYALLMHCYPSDTPPPFDRYRKTGLKKTSGYPRDPAF